MNLQNEVTEILKDAGYEVLRFPRMMLVLLTNRSVSAMEIAIALDLDSPIEDIMYRSSKYTKFFDGVVLEIGRND